MTDLYSGIAESFLYLYIDVQWEMPMSICMMDAWPDQSTGGTKFAHNNIIIAKPNKHKLAWYSISNTSLSGYRTQSLIILEVSASAVVR